MPSASAQRVQWCMYALLAAVASYAASADAQVPGGVSGWLVVDCGSVVGAISIKGSEMRFVWGGGDCEDDGTWPKSFGLAHALPLLEFEGPERPGAGRSQINPAESDGGMPPVDEAEPEDQHTGRCAISFMGVIDFACLPDTVTRITAVPVAESLLGIAREEIWAYHDPQDGRWLFRVEFDQPHGPEPLSIFLVARVNHRTGALMTQWLIDARSVAHLEETGQLRSSRDPSSPAISLERGAPTQLAPVKETHGFELLDLSHP